MHINEHSSYTDILSVSVITTANLVHKNWYQTLNDLQCTFRQHTWYTVLTNCSQNIT